MEGNIKKTAKIKGIKNGKIVGVFQVSTLDFPIGVHLYYSLPYLWQGFPNTGSFKLHKSRCRMYGKGRFRWTRPGVASFDL